MWRGVKTIKVAQECTMKTSKMIDQEWVKGPHWCYKDPPLNIEVEKLNILVKQRQIFTKLEVYVNIDLPSYLILFGGVQCSCYCMHARQVGG